MLTFCVLHITMSLVATVGNLLVIRALWKASSIPAKLKKLFPSLAFSDLAVGLIAQIMVGVILAMMLRFAANENYSFDLLCPTIISVLYFIAFSLACVSFLNVIAIAIDRLLAISLHLRYQELVTLKRVIIALVSLWMTSGTTGFILISFPKSTDTIVAIMEIVGFSLTTAAYIRIYRMLRYHQNQIHSQLQSSNAEAIQLLQQKRSAFNALFVYVVFIACYLPHLCSVGLLMYNNFRIAFLVSDEVTSFLVLLNSSLNPFIYCWRHREIRENVKITIKKIFRASDTST